MKKRLIQKHSQKQEIYKEENYILYKKKTYIKKEYK